MNESRFIELVNLYIDRQASPAEAAELEKEIQANPQHRQVYLQYCRMHHASRLVYESFRAQADQSGPAVRETATIAHFQSRQRQRRMRWVYAATGLAAAACLAFVFLRPANQPVTQATEIAAANPAPAPATMVAKAETATPAAPVAVEQAVAPTRPALTHDYATMMAALREDNSSQPRLQSLFDDGVFEVQPTVLPLRSKNQQLRRDPRAQTEFTAFQFQR